MTTDARALRSAQPEAAAPGLLDYYVTSLLTGIRALPGRHVRDSLARIINPLSYPRYMEYRLALQALGDLGGMRVLDIGSPKLPALLIARDRSCELVATDIRDYFVGSTAHFLRRNGLGDRIGSGVRLEVEDARHLSYGDATFDRVFSISVLEHIPDDGDSEAMREIARVLRPGGTVAVTVPFDAAGYREDYAEGRVFEREDAAAPVFYQRHYDLATLTSRLIAPSGLRVTDVTFFGEPGFRFEQYWNRIGMRLKLPLLWAQPFLAKLFLKELPPENVTAACGVALRLEKT
ncbi:MAG TPA: class I SAM-dependent methyltransferase [Dehalococcoidia bacterium]|nr:class I SAM-dependent methyltransferase [Dehalococcoidia bacterium]